MIAIQTKYLGPTNTRGSRIKAQANGYSVVIPYDYSNKTETLHAKAAFMLCHKMDLEGTLTCGAVKDGYVFTFSHANQYTYNFVHKEARLITK